MGAARAMTQVYLGLGANVGHRRANIALALELLHARGADVRGVSSVYETTPVGFARQPWFLNLACAVETSLAPLDLLRVAKGIEAALGRAPSPPNGPRVIDIDILLYDDLVVDSREVTVPHPRMSERAFVLAPLADLAPDLRHPLLGVTVGELLAAAPGREGVRPWGGPIRVG